MSLKQRNRLLITACILLTIVAVLTVLANRGHLGDLFGPPPKEKQKHQAQRENDSDQQKSPPRPEGEASAKRNRVATDTPPPGSSAPKLGSGTRHALGPRRPPADTRKVRHNQVVVGLDYLVGKSNRIVVGRIIGSRAEWSKDRKAIYTHYTMRVYQTLKGKHEGTATVRVIGGQIKEENVGLTVTHQPEFSNGDEGIVFLTNDQRLLTSVVGGEQGWLKFQSGKGPSSQHVLNGFGEPIVGFGHNNEFLASRERRARRLTSQSLKDKIRELVR